ncbi:MAG: hypothetical protein V3U71_09815 [Cocleimonas sp.]
MKLSSNLIGSLLIAAIGTTAFVYMAKRPAVEGNTVIFGAPNQIGASTTSKVEEQEVPKQEETLVETTEAKVETTESTTTEATTNTSETTSNSVEDTPETTETPTN